MGLSNTATPKYYGEFRRSVMQGKIPVCKEIAMEMHRIDELIANPTYYYDDRAINGFVKYCEAELTLTDGSPLHLLDSFKLWAESLLSWFYFVDRTVYVPHEDGHGGRWVKKRVKKRLVRKQYLIVARGAAKSMYVSCLQNYFLNIDTSTTRQIVTAPTMKQADEVMSPIRTSILKARGPLFKFLTEGSINNTTGPRAMRQKLVSTKKGIENFFTGSTIEIRPMSIDKLQGLNSKYNSVDEWLSGDIREDVIGAIEQGASKNDQDYIIIAISSEGTVRNGVGDSIKIELMKILKGESYAPEISIWHYRLDDVKEVLEPEMWLKANPNLGKTVQYEAYQLDVERAERAPATRNDILAKRFGLPVEGQVFFFSYEETLLTAKTPQSYRGMPCSMGADLSQGDDFCAFTFMFPLGNEYYGIKTLSFITDKTLSLLHASMREKYEEFINEGSLFIHEGITLDMEAVYEDVDQFIIDNEYDVRTFGFDPYNATEFVKRWTDENGPYGVEKVIQGIKTESVPLGEIKKLSEDSRLIFDQLLMKFAMGNAVVIQDTNNNRKIMKKRQEQKIDNVAALMDAYIAFKRNQDAFD